MKSANADEIFGFASDEIKSTHPPSRRISPNEVGFHRRRRFHPPARVDLVEKSTDKVDAFFWWGMVDSICIFFRLGRKKIMVSTSVCTGRSNMPQAYCIRIVRISPSKCPYQNKKHHPYGWCFLFWWGMVDSNHRRHSQQIYSLSPLATREIPHILLFRSMFGLEPVDGLVQSRCGSVKPSPATLIRVAF